MEYRKDQITFAFGKKWICDIEELSDEKMSESAELKELEARLKDVPIKISPYRDRVVLDISYKDFEWSNSIDIRPKHDSIRIFDIEKLDPEKYGTIIELTCLYIDNRLYKSEKKQGLPTFSELRISFL